MFGSGASGSAAAAGVHRWHGRAIAQRNYIGGFVDERNDQWDTDAHLIYALDRCIALDRTFYDQGLTVSKVARRLLVSRDKIEAERRGGQARAAGAA